MSIAKNALLHGRQIEADEAIREAVSIVEEKIDPDAPEAQQVRYWAGKVSLAAARWSAALTLATECYNNAVRTKLEDAAAVANWRKLQKAG